MMLEPFSVWRISHTKILIQVFSPSTKEKLAKSSKNMGTLWVR